MLKKPPEPLLPWLTYTKSLTQKLYDLTGNTKLEIINQQWQLPDAWEQTVLKIPMNEATGHQELVFHREILMKSLDVPCWYARTIIPTQTYENNKTLFKRLEQESLGQLIFNGPEIQRVSLKHYPILADNTEYRWLDKSLHQQQSSLWMRLSEFIVNQQNTFFLAEIILPGLLRYIK